MTACRSCERAELFVEAVEARLRALLSAERDRWEMRYPSLRMGFDAVESFVLGGGKRLRPRFVFWGHEAALWGHDARRERAGGAALVDLGAAVELFHAFALIHDDVMDDSDTRRHAPTVHHRFATLHQRRGWSGERRRVAEAFAVLLGDLAFAYSTQLLSELPPRTRTLFDAMRIELHVGQYLDLVGAADAAPAHELEAQADDIGRLKTATYSVERPLHLGSALADAQHLDGCWSAYGTAVGEAFQLRDDLLDVFGDPAVTGKPVGQDLNAGTSTPLIRHTLSAASAWNAARGEGDGEPGGTEQTAALDALRRLGSGTLQGPDVAAVGVFMQACGAVSQVEARIHELIGQANRTLAEAPISPEVRHGLSAMAETAAWRDR
ncbi:MAG: polyprenyl synthetase family protein [Acidimicrobiales bacterium]